MFIDTFARLCAEKGVTANKACLDLGISRTAVARWKKGSVPNGTTLALMAEYFGVTTDYLLGNEKTPATTGEREIGFDDFTYAFFEESKELTDENKQKLLELARFFKQQQDKDK